MTKFDNLMTLDWAPVSKNHGYFGERIDVSGIRKRKHKRVCFLLPSFPCLSLPPLPFALYPFFSVPCPLLLPLPVALPLPFSPHSTPFFPLFLLPPFSSLRFPIVPSSHLLFLFSFRYSKLLHSTNTTTQSKWPVNSPQKIRPISSSTALMVRFLLVWITMMLIASPPAGGIMTGKWVLIGLTNICCMANWSDRRESRGNAPKMLKEVLFQPVCIVMNCRSVILAGKPNNSTQSSSSSSFFSKHFKSIMITLKDRIPSYDGLMKCQKSPR